MNKPNSTNPPTGFLFEAMLTYSAIWSKSCTLSLRTVNASSICCARLRLDSVPTCQRKCRKERFRFLVWGISVQTSGKLRWNRVSTKRKRWLRIVVTIKEMKEKFKCKAKQGKKGNKHKEGILMKVKKIRQFYIKFGIGKSREHVIMQTILIDRS